MKKIKVRFSLYNGVDERHEGTCAHLLYGILKKYYDVEISDNPDYLFYHESTDDYLKYDCVKIFYTGENISPNFNFCDYAVGFDRMEFGDRYYRFPIYLTAVFYREQELQKAKEIDFSKQLSFTKDELSRKTGFCSFVYSNYRGEEARKHIFETLSTYKKVDAGGAYLNNVGGPVEDKLTFESQHKFSIAFENSSRSGYTTEKIVGAIMAQTIPIYWGDPEVSKDFNEKRFINCHAYENFDQVLERVKEIDQNDDLYLNMINEKVMADGCDVEKMQDGLEKFLKHIIDQPIEKAKRATINPVRATELKKREKASVCFARRRALIVKMAAGLYRPFKRFPFLEKLKHRFFGNK
jgi:hypothetical protein